ncbi:adenosine receptor A1-like [Antennarius striatus]|uniref:adenosine receptor A1-like n=1 Tax=Antennarius striatus TaxID=241820 RepID=UPI0035B2A58D
MNVTPDCCSVHTPYVSRFQGLYIAMELVVAVMAIGGNSLVCVAVVHNRRLRTVTNYFLISLAMSDILVGLVAVPCAVLTDLGQPRHNLPLCTVLLSILIALTQISILSMLAVAAERYMAILLPFQYRRVMSPRNARLVLMLTWVTAAIFGCVPLMETRKRPTNSSYCIFSCVVDMTYMVYFNCFCCFLLPLSAMFAIYGHIFITIRHQLRRIAVAKGTAKTAAAGGTEDAGSSSSSSSGGTTGGGGGGKASGVGFVVGTGITTVGPSSGSAPTTTSNVRTGRELRKATSLFLVLFLFMMCWMPIHLINTVQLLCPHHHVPLPVSLAAILLSHANSALNPILYAYRMRSFRRTLIGMCRGLWGGRPKPQ